MFFNIVIIYQHFLQETKSLLVSVRLQTAVLLFLCFSAFCELQCLFYMNAFALTFIMRIFYFIVVWCGVKINKIKKNCLFLQTSKKFAIKNNPPMKLHLIFHKTVNKNKLVV